MAALPIRSRVKNHDGQQPEWRGNLERLFKEMDTNGDGVLDIEEIAVICTQMGKRFTEQQLNVAVSAMDSDGDGEVSFEEFAAWWTENGGLDLWALFREADADGSGFLDVTEVETLCQRMGKELSPPELEAAMAKMDFDGSGQVDWIEFNKWWANNAGVRHELRTMNSVNLVAADAEVQSGLRCRSCWSDSLPLLRYETSSPSSTSSKERDMSANARHFRCAASKTRSSKMAPWWTVCCCATNSLQRCRMVSVCA